MKKSRPNRKAKLDPVRAQRTARRAALITGALLVTCGMAWVFVHRAASLRDRMRVDAVAPTFNQHIAPIVFQNCAPCHRPGQSAPFSLLSCDDAQKHAKEILEVTTKRIMPPWLPEPGFGEFANERRLDDAQIALFRRWVETGMAAGAPADLPVVPKSAEGWQLGQPDLVVQMPQSYALAAEGRDVYRNFVIPVPVTERKYVQAVEFLPGNARIVHHAFMKMDRTPESRRRDEQDPEPGFAFMETPDSAQMPEGHFLGWTPGSIAMRAPNGLAWTLERDTDLVLQMHMNPSGKPEAIQSSVGFYFTQQPPTNSPFKILLTSRAIDIPADERAHVITDEFRLPVDVDVLAVLPHAHYLAKEMQAWATLPDGTKRWLLWIKDWNFNWQGDFRYTRPVALPRDARISMRFIYDNSSANTRNPHHPPRRVTYGPQTTDEMAELWLQVLPRQRDDVKQLVAAFQKKMLQVMLDRWNHAVTLNADDAAAHNGLGQALLGFYRVPEAIEHFRRAIQLKPDLEEPHFFLGFLYRQGKQLAAARAEYETVVRLNPRNHEAHGNLGLVFIEQNNLDRAQAEFEEALRLKPDDAVAQKNLDVIREARAKATRGN
ncbi:MAG: tetratricopeptide repeat protein [Verrucomicrobia bacterium]|nr:tetratricopeptide repeat protein [Verrucomicrobiota bacterium]